MVRVIITGGTGSIGVPLVKGLIKDGHEALVLSRNPQQAAVQFAKQGLMTVRTVGWDGQSAEGWGGLVNAETVVVNLAGENIGKFPWDDEHKRRVLESRLKAGRAVRDAIQQSGERGQAPLALIQASAVGYYGSRGDEVLTEGSPRGQGFLADICDAWEQAIIGVTVRTCVLRIGIVLDKDHGALPAFVNGVNFLSSQLGSGQQWFPWMHMADMIGATRFLMDNTAAEGVFNCCAPNPVTNRQMLATLGSVLGRPVLFPVPEFALRALLGEMAETVLVSQRVQPQRLLQAGYRFQFDMLEPALRNTLGR